MQHYKELFYITAALVMNVDSLEDTTAGLQIEVTVLDQRVKNLEAGGGGANVVFCINLNSL